MRLEDIKTYVDNVCSREFDGLTLIVSSAAMRELKRYGMDEVVHILENGKDAPRKRKKGTIERWLDTGGITWNAVVIQDYNAALQNDVWVLAHVGRFR